MRRTTVMELKTLVIVWAITHFHSYYGNRVTVGTVHSAIKAVLETSNTTGIHDYKWTRVCGQGVKRVHIVCNAGWENATTKLIDVRRGDGDTLGFLIPPSPPHPPTHPPHPQLTLPSTHPQFSNFNSEYIALNCTESNYS